MAIEKNIRLEPHKSRDLLVSKKSNKKRPKYQPPGGGATSRGSGRDVGGGHGRGRHAPAAASSAPTTAQHHPGESTGRERAIASTTYSRPGRLSVTRPSHHIGAGDITQNYNKNLRTIQRRQDYNRLANQRAHPFLSKLGGLGGLLKGIGKAGLSFFGGIPGKLMSGIMTASDYAKRKGSGVLQGIGEFGDTDEEGNPLYPTWDRYINRNTGKYDDKPYLGQGQSNYTFDDQVATNVTNPNLNLNTIDTTDTNYIPQNIPLEEELLNTPTFAAEGGRIGYATRGFVDPEEPAEDIFEIMRDQGVPIGEQVEGEITDEQRAMVLDMLEKGMDIETIISITGVGQEDILSLMGGTSMAPDSEDQGIASLV